MGALAAHAFAAGEVKAWGDNAFGGLGDGSTTNRSTPVATSGLTDVTAVAGGDGFSLALRYDSTVWAWGYNADGELGIGTNVGKLTPVQIPSLSNVVAITSCNHHSLALKSDGTVWAWGKNTYGQLGDGTTTDRWAPVQVIGLTNVQSIATGVNHSLASTTGGLAYAWGRNEAGQVGDGSTTNRWNAVQVATITNVKAVSSHGNLHSHALLNDGTVWSWGNNFNGCRLITSSINRPSACMTVNRVWPSSGCGRKAMKYTAWPACMATPTSESNLKPPMPGPCPARGSTTTTGRNVGLTGMLSGGSRCSNA